MADLQKMIDEKRAAEQQRKEEKEAEKERKKREEAEELINGILQIKNDRDKAKQQEIEEDKKNFEQFEESKIKEVLKTDFEFRGYIANEQYKDAIIKDYGIANYEQIKQCLKELEAEEREIKRQESIANVNCPF